MRMPTAERPHPHEVLFCLDGAPVSSKSIQRIYRFPNGWGLSVSGLADRNAWDFAVVRYWGEEPWDWDIAWSHPLMMRETKHAHKFTTKQIEGILAIVEAIPMPEEGTPSLPGVKRGRPIGSKDRQSRKRKR
jgi:hypothetical protein